MAEERYKELELIGKGSMSAVWLARDLQTQEVVVLKIMLPREEDDKRHRKALERFGREIEIASMLKHPNILPIREYGYRKYGEWEVPFLILPYMEEGSLANLMQERPPWKYWTLRQTMDTIRQAAESLWCLHNQHPQIVHRDVKPGNFLVRTVDRPERAVQLYLCDFGISRWLESTEITAASELLGTYIYMAPEQIEKKIHAATDQYALAVVASYLLTGKLPIQAETHELYMQAHIHDRPILPSQLNPKRIKSALIDQVMARALAKRPTERYPSILIFAQELEKAVEDQIHLQLGDPFPLIAEVTTEKDLARLDEADARPGEGVSFLIDDTSFEERKELNEPLPNKRSQAVPALSSEQIVAREIDVQPFFRLELPDRPKQLLWSPDGGRVVCVLYRRAPLIVGRDGSLQNVTLPQNEQVTWVDWSPDGNALALSVAGRICFWDCQQQKMFPFYLPFDVRMIECFHWSRLGQLAVWLDGHLLIYTLNSHTLTRLQTVSPQMLTTPQMRGGNPGVIAWSPTGEWLATGASNGTLVCWRPDLPGKSWKVRLTSEQKITYLAWSPDSQIIVAAFRDQRVEGWDIVTHDVLFSWPNLPSLPRMVSISSGNRVLISTREKRLVLGMASQAQPAYYFSGQLLINCSPMTQEIAYIDPQKETVLCLAALTSE